MTISNWDSLTVEERNQLVLNKIKSGQLEIIYSRPDKGLFYVTLKPPKVLEDGIHDGKVVVDGKVVGRQG